MIFECFKWFLTFASMTGVVLNIKRRRECFYIWAGTNASWSMVDAYHGIWSQACLFAVYWLLALWGLWEWRKGATKCK